MGLTSTFISLSFIVLLLALGLTPCYGESDSLDSVLDGGSAAGTFRLDSGDQGNKTFTFTQSDTLKLSALLSTYGQAELTVNVVRANGESFEFMKWERSDAADSSPLYIDGKPVSESMFERSGGDFSPNEIDSELEVSKGDKVTVSLNGDIGEGDAFLSINGKEIENSSSGSSSSFASSGGKTLDFKKDWQFEVSGEITKTAHFARLFQGDGSIHSRRIDAFTAHGNGLRFRLCNKKISFTSASVGSVHNPGAQADHWLVTTVGSVRKGENVSVKVVYSCSAKNLKIYWNGKLVADASFKINSMPSSVKSINLTGMNGTVK